MSIFFRRLQWGKLHLITAAFGIITSLTGGFILILFNFDGIEFNGDSYEYFKYAKHFKESITTFSFPKPMHWPYGYPSLLALTFTFGDVSYESARWVNVVIGGLLALLLCSTMLFVAQTNKLDHSQTMIVLLFIGAFQLGHGMFLKYQITMMSDLMAAFLGTGAMLMCWKWKESDNKQFLISSGIFLGLAITTRYVYSLMAFPIITVILSNIKLRSWKSIGECVLASSILFFTAMLTFTPQLFITLQDISSSIGNDLFNGWNIKNFYSLTHDSVDGHQTAKFPSFIYYSTLPFRMQCFTPLGIVFTILGLRYAIRNLPKWFWLSNVVWYLTFDLFLCGIPLQNGRIGFPLCLPILIIMSLGMLECWIKYRKYFGKILIFTFLIWCISLAISLKLIKESLEEKSKTKLTAEAVALYVPKHARVISTSLYAVYNVYPMSVDQSSIYEMDLEMAKNLFIVKKPTFLAIDESHFIPQWSNYGPGKCYDWIRSNYNCIFRFKSGEYTIYEVSPK